MQNYIHSALLDNYIVQNAQMPRTALQKNLSYNLPQPKSDEFVNSKKSNAAKIALASAVALTSATCVFAAIRHKGNISKSVSNTFKKVKNFFSSQTDKAKNAATEISQKTGSLSEYQNGLNNITNAKDAATRNVLNKIPGYKKFDAFCTKIYKKACSGSLEGSYKSAQNSAQKTKTYIDNAIQNGSLDEKSGVRIKELIFKNLDAATANNGVKERFERVDKSMRGLDVNAMCSIKRIKPNKKGVVDGIKEYSKKGLVEKRLQKSKSIQNDLMEEVINKGLNADEAKELEGLISKIKDKNLLRQIGKSDKTLEKALTKENSAMFDKLRDINCGSAPTDVLGMLGTTGLLGIYTMQADSKEEKVGVTLTTGMPLAVTLATTLVGTLKMISGGKALLLGLGTGFVSNRIGKIANKKYQEKHNITEPNKTIPTISDYKKIPEKLKSIKG